MSKYSVLLKGFAMRGLIRAQWRNQINEIGLQKTFDRTDIGTVLHLVANDRKAGVICDGVDLSQMWYSYLCDTGKVSDLGLGTTNPLLECAGSDMTLPEAIDRAKCKV